MYSLPWGIDVFLKFSSCVNNTSHSYHRFDFHLTPVLRGNIIILVNTYISNR